MLLQGHKTHCVLQRALHGAGQDHRERVHCWRPQQEHEVGHPDPAFSLLDPDPHRFALFSALNF